MARYRRHTYLSGGLPRSPATGSAAQLIGFGDLITKSRGRRRPFRHGLTEETQSRRRRRVAIVASSRLPRARANHITKVDLEILTRHRNVKPDTRCRHYAHQQDAVRWKHL